MRYLLSAALLTLLPMSAAAIDLKFDGFYDLRVAVPSEQRSWVDGGLGKTRFGSEYRSDPLIHGEVYGEAILQLAPSLMGFAVARIEGTQRTFLDWIEAYVRYRPVSTNAFRFTFKAGVFFPPVSMENTDIGWTSPWTLTPSAINSWIGEELRTIGGEAKVELRKEGRVISVTAAGYGWNDPMGIMLADRGWAMNDRPTGLLDRLRLPDAYARSRNAPIPMHTLMFAEIDRQMGWYLGASWDEAGLGRAEVLYYNNEADPAVSTVQIAWETDFWSAGLRTQIGDVTLIAQGMTGSTLIRPSPSFFSDTAFESAFLLAGWTPHEDWRLAARFDVFATNESRPGAARLSEHGNAQTVAVNYFPYSDLRITAEALRIDSTRAQRSVTGISPRTIETQFQVNARFYLP